MNTDNPEAVIAQALYHRDIKSLRTDSTYGDDARNLIDSFSRAGFKIVRNEDGVWSWRKARGVLAPKEEYRVLTQDGSDSTPTMIVGPEATSVHDTDVCSVSIAAGPDGLLNVAIFEHAGIMLGRQVTVRVDHVAAEVDLTQVAKAIWNGMIERGNIRGMTYEKAVALTERGDGNWRELVEQVNHAALTSVTATNALRAGYPIEPTPCVSCGRVRADTDSGDYCADCAAYVDRAMPVVNRSTRPRSGVRAAGSTITRVSVRDDDQ